MGRHTIGNKRGSVRGAPPDVYVGFASFDDDDGAAWEDALDVYKGFICGLVFFTVIVVACAMYVMCGGSYD